MSNLVEVLVPDIGNFDSVDVIEYTSRLAIPLQKKTR
jgi:hypothetical protein